MQLALVNDDRVEAFPNGRGIFPICIDEIQDEVDKSYNGYHQFNWAT